MQNKDFHDFSPEVLGFKRIPGFSDYYASRSGGIYSVKSTNGRQALGKLKRKRLYNAKDGYCTVGLTPDDDTIQIRCHVHVIIAKTWLLNPEKLKTVNHKDGNGRNNKVSNLEWSSHSNQIKHAHATGLIKKKAKAVCQTTKEGKFVAEFSSITEAFKSTGITVSRISAVCLNRRRYTGGFAWYFKEDYKGQKPRKFGNCKTVYQYSLKGKFIREFESADEAAKCVKVHPGTMADACRGKQETCKGYIWKYAPKEAKKVPIEKCDASTWVVVPEFPKYRISTDGRIFSHFHNRELKPSTRKNMSKKICLTDKEGSSKNMAIHQLVARAYLPNPKKYPLVKHLDDDPSNNNVENLEWDNYSGNGFDAYSSGINSNKHPVIRLAKSGKELERYGGVTEAATKIGVSRTALSYALNGKTKTCCGFKWIYA